jgi:cell division protein ZapE
MSNRNLTPLQRYERDLSRSDFIADPLQKEALQLLQPLYEQLIREDRLRQGWHRRLAARFLNRWRPPHRGFYFWGGVGRGKTYLVDLFFESLPIKAKLRMHFHRFMQRVHHELKDLREQIDPLQIVAARFADQTLVICFDEFYVSDITDAMLLGNLLQALFDRGITLVATSNEHPDQLYRGGLQRERFLPAIELIKANTRVFHLDSDTDYRLRYLDSAEIYHFPLDDRAGCMLLANFEHLAPDAGSRGEKIEIEGREIETVRSADGVAWFEFDVLCGGPRGAADYIELGRLYQTILIANIPQMDDGCNDVARRFITLIDEFYDRNVRVIMTAATGAEHLYRGERLAVPFRRTRSRLVEMQSHDYLARQHLSE